MANFDLNIQPIPPAWYTETFYMFPFDSDCGELVTSTHTVGTLKAGEDVADVWIFSTIDHPYKYDNRYLKISNMYSSHPDNYYLEYNGVKIPNGTFDPDNPQVVIDIYLLAVGAAIPGLLFKFVNHDPDGGAYISFQVSMERESDGIEGMWVFPRFNTQNIVCEPDPEPEIIANDSSADNCSTNLNVTVLCPVNSSRFVEIIPNDGFGTVASTTTITANRDFDLAILGETVGTYTTFSNVTITTRLSESSSTIIDSMQITRAHNGTTC